jgi:hypothetical protein
MESNSEAMLHSPVDSLIRFPLDTISTSVGANLPIEMDRNRKPKYVFTHFLTIMTKPSFICFSCLGGTSVKTRSCPDFLLWMGNILLLWGQESIDAGTKGDLNQKLTLFSVAMFSS